MFEQVSADELASREALARKVRNELAAAGLPVLTPGLNPVLAGGAEVMVDNGADLAGGVFAGWSASPRLQACTSRALRLRLLDDPLLRHSSEIAAAMMQAIDAPAQGTPPMWSLRDEELTMPGWKTNDPGEDTGNNSAQPSTGQT